ncbi:(E3-independent) E2 ubiquitin-conjugating enzyme [Ranunculus cassubicifolius]
MSKENADADADNMSKEVMEPRVVGIYRQDIVTCKNGQTSMVGIVTQVAGDTDSDSDSSDEDEDDDDSGDDGDEDHQDGEVNDNVDKINDYGEKNDPLSTDQVRVVWMDHSETTQNASDVTVIDRAFMHGDIVAAASDPTGQVGVVEDVSISVDLLSFNGTVVKDICSRHLKRIREFSVGDYVVLGPWLGRVDDVLDNVTVLFDDGSMCKVSKADPFRLKPVSKSFAEDGHFPYYPGQRVRASSSSVFKNARWISGLWKANRMEGTVTRVTVGSVYIYWIASAGYGPECATTPAEEQSPKNLKLLSCFAHSFWQVGDWCFLPSPAVSSDSPVDKSSCKVKCDGCTSGDPEGDRDVEGALLEQSGENHPSPENIVSTELDMVSKLDRHTGNAKTNSFLDTKSCSSSLSVPKEPAHDNRPLHRKKLRKILVRRDKKARKKDENFERALLIVNTVTMVDVVWQDGRREHGISSPTLIPIDNPGDQEFVAEQYVVEKVTEEDDDFSAVRRVGVVKSVNAKERTACVRWLKQVSRPEDPREFDNEEVVSVYELETHPDFDYCYGDVVVRLTPVFAHLDIDDSTDLAEETNDQVGAEEATLGANSKCEKLEDAANSELYADFSDLSWVGNISGLKDGDIEVTWADGMVSTVGPQAIYVVGRDEDEESIGAGSEISDDDAASWETVQEGEMDAVENTEEESGSQNLNSVIAGEDNTVVSEESNSVRNGPLSIPLAALGFSTRLLTGFLSWGKKQIDPLMSEHNSEHGSQSLGSVDDSERRKSTSEYTSQGPNATDGNSYFCENEEQDRPVSDVAYNRMVPETISELRSEEDDADSMTQSYVNGPSNFKHFDTAKDPLDHFFLGANDQCVGFPRCGGDIFRRDWLRR